MSATNVQNAALAHPSLMIAGEREVGSLARFAATPEMAHSMVDPTLDAATIADRQREGGGAPRERRPARVRRWRTLLQRVRALWPGRTSPRPPSDQPSLAVEPSR
jgi:hypothetical protein